MIKYIFGTFSLLFLIYLLLPGPVYVEEFPALPSSLKSKEPGDTYQNPNTVAYFSDYFRADVIPFYLEEFRKKFRYLGLSLPFIRLNHPPQYAQGVIRPHIQSYYLEEFVLPLRESLFVSGWEPFDELGRKRFGYSHGIIVEGRPFKTKVTLKYYTSPLWVRILVWSGMMIFTVCLYRLYQETLKQRYD